MQTLEEILEEMEIIERRLRIIKDHHKSRNIPPQDINEEKPFTSIIDRIKRLGVNKVNIIALIKPIIKALEDYYDQTKGGDDGIRIMLRSTDLHAEVRDTLNFLEELAAGSKGHNKDLLNYLVPIVLYSTERRDVFDNDPVYKRFNKKLIEELIGSLDTEERSLTREFIQFMFENNYQPPKNSNEKKVFDWPYNAEGKFDYLKEGRLHHIEKRTTLSALEVLVCHLTSEKQKGPKHRVPSDKSKQILFRSLVERNVNFDIEHLPLVEEYVYLLEEEYDDRDKATECLSLAFSGIASLCDPQSVRDVIPSMERGVKTLEDIANLLRKRPRSPVFYDLVKTFVTNNRFDHILNSLETFERLRETENLMEECIDFFDRYFYAIRSDERYLVPNALEVLAYNEVRDVEELRLCSETSVEDYIPIRVVGKGGSSIVFKAVDVHDGLNFALKKYKRSVDTGDSNLERFVRRSGGIPGVARKERIAAIQLTHDNIVRYFGRKTDSEGNEVIIQEFVDGFSLEEYVRDNRPLDKKTFLTIFTNTIEGLLYMQQKGYVHRDIKPSNILIARDLSTAKITDLQIAIQVGKEGHKILTPNEIDGEFTIGARSWAAPELTKDGRASFQSDIYSLGLCICYALTGEHPTPDVNQERIGDSNHINTTIKTIIDRAEQRLGELRIDSGNKYDLIHLLPGEYGTIVEKMTEIDPQKRLSSNELREVQERLKRLTTTF